ncbi:hypothetical protein HGB47_04825 [Leptospira yasudae]|uniref:hypothetical protein n=1 Tax=Leptospira yasudae TaxID=2202201 RepID=UPI0011C4A857|nr:hypothetical protein [Leptospira yasudae]MBW0432935.1 hypothetical protein [Leptospira yasudae]
MSALLILNCAVFEHPKTFKEFKPESNNKLAKSTFLILTDEQNSYNSTQLWKEYNNAVGRKGMFTDFNVYLNSEPDPKDKFNFQIRFDCRRKNKIPTKNIILGLVNILSIGLIPVWVDDTVSYSAEIFDFANGKTIKSFRYENRKTTYMHLFLIPVSANPKYSPNDLIFEHFLETIYKDGSIPFENESTPAVTEVIK